MKTFRSTPLAPLGVVSRSLVLHGWKRVMKRSLRIVVRTFRWSLLTLILYLLSYAPFLWAATFFGTSFHRGPYYRSPAVYRVADWFVVSTPAQSTLLGWADCFGVRDTTEFQGWYFAQGVSDTSEFHFNLR